MSAVGSDYILKEADITALLEVLSKIRDKWKELICVLELPCYLNEKFSKESLILALNGVIREWIAGNGVMPITLGTLKTKLENDIMEEKTFAKDLIANFYITKFGETSPEATSVEAVSSEAAPRGCIADSASK